MTDLRDCNINGHKCLVLIDDGKQASLDSSDASVKVRSWAQFLVTLPEQVQEKKPEAAVPPPATNPTPKDSPISTETPTSAKAAVVASVMSSWVGGFNGSFQLKNTSSDSWTSWSLKLTMPAGVTDEYSKTVSVLAMVEQMAAAASSLRSQAREQVEIVSTFKFDSDNENAAHGMLKLTQHRPVGWLDISTLTAGRRVIHILTRSRSQEILPIWF